MRQLCIYVHRSGRRALHEGGFSWLAAGAPPMWALGKYLYKTAAVAFVSQLVLILLVPWLIDQIANLMVKAMVEFAYISAWWLVPGFGASRWHRHVLERAGFVVGAIETSVQAERK